MKYAWIEVLEDGEELLDDEGNSYDPPEYEQIRGNGVLTGLNRGAIEGELSGTCSPQDRVWGMQVAYYRITDGVLVPLSSEEVSEIEDAATRSKALTDMLDLIDEKNREENLKDFTYGDYPYYSDSDSIQAVAIEASQMDSEDAIPVPSGVWKTAAYDEETLIPVYVAFTCGEFSLFKTAYFLRSSDNFGVKEMHKNNVKTLYATGSTAQEIYEYDFSEGWR